MIRQTQGLPPLLVNNPGKNLKDDKLLIMKAGDDFSLILCKFFPKTLTFSV